MKKSHTYKALVLAQKFIRSEMAEFNEVIKNLEEESKKNDNNDKTK